MKSGVYNVAAGIAVGAVCAALLAFLQIRNLEQQVGLGWLFQSRGAVKPPDQVVMVLINQQAASNISLPRHALDFHRCKDLRIGPPPSTHQSLPSMPSRWPRCVHALLVDKLAAAGVRMIAFDVLFRQRPPLPGADEDLHAWQDEVLAKSFASAGHVVIAQKIEISDGQEKFSDLSPVIANAALGSAPFPLIAEPGRRADRFMTFKESGLVTATLPAIALQAYAVSAYPGLVDLLARSAGETAMLLPQTVESLESNRHLQATALLIRKLWPGSTDAGMTAQLRSLAALYSGNGTRLLNLYGPAGTVPAISYDQVLALSPESMASRFHGRAVFVGFAETLQTEQVEHFATAFSSGGSADLSGVEIAATAFANLLHDRTIRELDPEYWLALTFLAGLLSYLACAQWRNRVALAVMVIAIGAYAGGALYLFTSHDLWMPVVMPMVVAAPAGMLVAFSWKYWTVHKQRAQLRHAFTYFVPGEVVSMLERNAGQLGGSQESVECACVATDAANFTPLAESMTPEKLTEFLNHYFETLFGRVANHGGFVSDVVGDAMLAIWPHRSAGTHLQLLHALLEMRDAAQIFNEQLAGNRLMTRFGVDWGRVALTTVGAHAHYEYRAVGDAVNTAARIQEFNKKLGTRVLLSRPAIGNAGGDFLLRDLGSFLLRGKSHAVHLFELLASRALAKPQQVELCAQFEAAIAGLQDRRSLEALARFQAIHAEFPADGPTAFYLRCLEAGLTLQDGALVID
ncbi:MAG: adenylate/guanylate cyclase domain-containing protein [Steroidobacteraceae bacterium]